MIAEASAAISGIKVAMDLAKGIAALKSETEINQAIIDIQRTLLDAQSAALADKHLISQLHDQVGKLQAEVDAKKDWAAEQAKYILVKSPRGVFYYELRAEIAEGEITHRLCAHCFDQGRRSILHTMYIVRGGEHVECHQCRINLQLTDRGPSPPIPKDF